jgi:outer membrane protein assembly factor BamA
LHPATSAIGGRVFRRLLFIVLLLTGAVTGTPSLHAQQADRNVREIRISKLKYTKRETIIREMVSRVGEPFRRANIVKDKERLDRLGIFSSIEINAIEENNEIVVDIEVKETFPYLPMLSIEVTDENGVSAGPGFRAVNLFGRAVRFIASARFGGATNAEVRMTDPWFAGNRVGYDVHFFQRDRKNKLDDFNELSTELNGRVGTWLGDKGRIGGRLGFLSLGSDRDGVTLSDDNRDNVPSAGFFLGYDSRDLVTNPHRGWWNELDISKNAGNADFWKLIFDVRRYQPIANRHTLVLFSLLTLQTGEVDQDIPSYLDFHIGGTNTIRGWDLDARSGKNEFINTVGYRYIVVEPRSFTVFGTHLHLGLQLTVFGDFGNAWNESNEFKLDNFIDGYGFGVRLLVPFVEMIRLDFGWGEPGQGMRFHFALFEKPVMQRFRVR